MAVAITENSPQLQGKILAAIELLSIDPAAASLKLYELTGHLEGYWTVSVNRNCQIIFTFTEEGEEDEDSIVLINIVSQDEVY